MWLMIILKVTKNQNFSLSLEDLFLKKPPGGVGGGGVKLKLTPQALLELKGKIFLSLSPHYENT